MIRIKVSLKNGRNKTAVIDSKKKCAQWLNLLHEDWHIIELKYDRKTVELNGKLSLNDWVKQNG